MRGSSEKEILQRNGAPQMKKWSRITHHVSDTMKVFCILGDGRVQRSKSPIMHNGVMRRRRISGIYVPFAVRPECVGEAVRGIRALGILGSNVTVPHKETVVPYLDSLSEEASAIGAVNTIVRREEILKGHNTDVGGFMDALSEAGLEVAERTALVFGAGGAAKAVLLGLNKLECGVIWVTSRNIHRTKRAAAPNDAKSLPLEVAHEVAPSVDVLINATSVSSRAEGPELAALVENLDVPNCSLVFDLNYGRNENFWRRKAEADGVDFMDGIPMLVHQAKRSFALWTDIQPAAEEFLEALREGP